VPSYKIRNGTFVLCTPEEAAERERRKAVQVEVARAQAAKPRFQAAPDGMAFAKLMRGQVYRMYGLSTTWDVFCALLFESFRHHGRSFVLPIKQLTEVPGLSPKNLYRILQQLQRRGLITVIRRRPKPPIVIVHE
jgi:hypothetical protein